MVDFYLFKVPVKVSQITKLLFTTQTIRGEHSPISFSGREMCWWKCCNVVLSSLSHWTSNKMNLANLQQSSVTFSAHDHYYNVHLFMNVFIATA